MDIGTGKDLADYRFEGKEIPYHLIDIVDAGERYNVYRYVLDFWKAYKDVRARGLVPILCGGSGMYIEAVCRGYEMPEVPENRELRQECEGVTQEELIKRLASYGPLHNTTDTQSRKRLIRAIEIAEYRNDDGRDDDGIGRGNDRGDGRGKSFFAPTDPYIIGLYIPVEERRTRIDRRLDERLQSGMVEEALRLMKQGLTVEDMMYYGLEYKYLALYLTGALSFEEMRGQLRVAIHQFAKRQMTWFRGMERRGLAVRWVDAMVGETEIVKQLSNDMIL
jgi:tRNA dimethylallyltransferase